MLDYSTKWMIESGNVAYPHYRCLLGFWIRLGIFLSKSNILSRLMRSSRRCNRAFELMNGIFFGKCLGTSISPHFASCTHSLIHQMFALTWSSNCENKMTHYKKLPLVILIDWSFGHFKGFGVTRPERDLESSSWTWQVRRPRE